MHYNAFCTDLNENMISKTLKNLDWLQNFYLKSRKITNIDPANLKFSATHGDATSHTWHSNPIFHAPIAAVVCETYLGPPLSNPPAQIKLTEIKQSCSSLILAFLKNLSNQISVDTPVVLAVPAWLRPDGSYSSMNLLDSITQMGYNVKNYQGLSQSDLLYHREGQVVAREIISLRKK